MIIDLGLIYYVTYIIADMYVTSMYIFVENEEESINEKYIHTSLILKVWIL